MKKNIIEKDLGKHNNATTGFKALAKKTNAKIAGAQLAKMRAKGQVEEGQGDFDKALSTISGWYEDESSNPNIRVYHYDDREGGYYADGEILHNLKTGEITIDYHGEYNDEVKGTFHSVGDAMNALRGGYPGDHGRGSNNPKHDSLANKTLAGPDDLYKTDRAGKKGTLTKSRMDVMKASSPYTMRGGPKGHLPENFNGEYDDEAGMAEGSLHTLKRAVDGLMNTIESHDDLPEWCQEKISIAEDYLVTVWDYIQSEKEQGNDPQISEHKKGVKAMKYTKKAKPINPVAKNSMAALGGGAAGAHKDKKNEIPRKAKHKKAPALSEGWYELRLQTLLEANQRAIKK